MKKPILCPSCEISCIEVKFAILPDGKKSKLYPKEIYDHKAGNKTYHEYRYLCQQCKKEWVHNTLWNQIEPVLKDSQFTYDEARNVLTKRESKHN